MRAVRVHIMRKNRPQCGLLIEDHEGKILLQLRDDQPTIPYPNCWGTFGGQVELNETPDEAIRREIKEELEYEVSHPEYFGTFPFDGYDIYMFRTVDPSVTLDNIKVREGQRGAFFTLDEVRDIPCAFNCLDIVVAYFAMYH